MISKTILTFTLGLLCFIESPAMCIPYYMDYWPKEKTIVQDGIIILEEYSFFSFDVEQIGTKYPAFLKSGTNIVELSVVSHNTSTCNLAQVILRPKTMLVPGQHYELVIDSLNEDANRYLQHIVWEAVKSKPSNMQALNVELNETGKHYMLYGCGPEYYVKFKMNIAIKSQLLVKASVRHLTTGKIQTYILILEKPELIIGRDMCSGAFELMDEEWYELNVQIIDKTGQVGPTSSTLTFQAPDMSTL